MTDKHRNKLYWLFKSLSILVSCAFPVWAVCEKFPLWKVQYGTDHSIGVGTILILFVIAIIARRSVFRFFQERLKLNHAPPLLIWFVLLIVAYLLVFIADFLMDLTTVLWMGIVGCSIGTVLTYIAENNFGKKDKNDE